MKLDMIFSRRIHTTAFFLPLLLSTTVLIHSFAPSPVNAATVTDAAAPQTPTASSTIVIAPQAKEKTQSESLTLETILRTSYLQNSTLQAQRAQLKATHEQLPQALAGWRPTVLSSAGVTYNDIDSDDSGDGSSTSKDLGLSLDQPLYRGGRTTADIAAARSTISARELLLIAQEQDILREAATIYMDVLRDKALLELSQSTRDVIARELEATQDRFDVGELTKTDVSQAQARVARADAAITTATGNLNASKARFEEITGMPAENLIQPAMALVTPQTLEEATLQAEQNSPLILSSVFAQRASEEDIDGVYGELLPEVGFASSWNKVYDPAPGLVDEQTTSTIGIRATLPLYEAGAVRSRVREAKHTANQRYIEILETRRQVRQEVVSNWADLQAAQAEIRSRKAQVEASAVAQEGVTQETELGARTVLDVLDANQELLDARVALVTAERNEVVARFSLLSTLGSLTPQTLGFGDDAYDYRQNLAEVQGKIFDMNVDRLPQSE